MILCADTIITGDGETRLKDSALRVSNEGIITDIGQRRLIFDKYPDESVKDYGNASILPGLIDSHVHLCYFWDRDDTAEFDDYLAAFIGLNFTRQALTKGVTTVRDVSSPENFCRQLVNAASKGWFTIPRVIFCGAGLNMTGGHSWTLKGGNLEVDGEWEIRKAIRKQIREGATWIKLMQSHRSFTPEFTQCELDAAVDEVHRVGKKICVHAGTQPAIQMAIDAGFDTIEHGTFMTLKQAEEMKEKGLVWVPTIYAYTYIYEEVAKLREKGLFESAGYEFDYFRDAAFAYQENFKNLIDVGLKYIVGTDMVMQGSPYFPVAQEMTYMEKFGLPALECIKAATKTPSEVLGIDDHVGTLAVEKDADIAVFKGDCSETVANTMNTLATYIKGKLVYDCDSELPF